MAPTDHCPSPVQRSTRKCSSAGAPLPRRWPQAGVLIDCAPVQPAFGVDDLADRRRRGGADRRARCRDQGTFRRFHAGRLREPGRGPQVGGNAPDSGRRIDRDSSGRRRHATGLTSLMPAEGNRQSEMDAALREHWWAAVASITRKTGDLEIAEDAVQEACAAAVAQWPRDGIPAEPARVAHHHRVAQGRRPDAPRRAQGGARG